MTTMDKREHSNSDLSSFTTTEGWVLLGLNLESRKTQLKSAMCSFSGVFVNEDCLDVSDPCQLRRIGVLFDPL